MVARRADSVDIEVGQSIKAHRLAAGLSQTALADGIGVTFQQVQKYEKGSNRVGAGRLTRIARTLDIPVTAFFAGRDRCTRSSAEGANSALSLLTQPEALRLLRAYSKISDGLLRHLIVQTVEGLAVKMGGQARRRTRRYGRQGS